MTIRTAVFLLAFCVTSVGIAAEANTHLRPLTVPVGPRPMHHALIKPHSREPLVLPGRPLRHFNPIEQSVTKANVKVLGTSPSESMTDIYIAQSRLPRPMPIQAAPSLGGLPENLND